MKKFISLLSSTALFLILPACDGDSSGSTTSPITGDNSTLPLPNNFDQVSETGTASKSQPAATESMESQVESEIYSMINSARAQRGLPSLRLDSRLSVLESSHNATMGVAGRNGGTFFGLSHDGFFNRSDQAFALGYSKGGENVAALVRVQPSALARTFVDNWVNSPTHLKNITGNFTATGISVYVDPVSGIVYASQFFAG